MDTPTYCNRCEHEQRTPDSALIARMNHLDRALQRDAGSLRQDYYATQTSLTFGTLILFGTIKLPAHYGKMPYHFHVPSSKKFRRFNIVSSMYHPHSVGAFALTGKNQLRETRSANG